MIGRIVRQFKFHTPRYLNSQALSPELLDQKMQTYEQVKPSFSQFFTMDPDMMAHLPYFLNVFDPVIEMGKNSMLSLHDYTGMPWWGVIATSCFLTRLAIMPLIIVSMRRSQKLAGIAPVLIQSKKLVYSLKISRTRKFFKLLVVWFDLIREQKLKMSRLLLYNLFHFPILITLIWSLRRLMVEESFRTQSFLWIPSLTGIDPYFVLPFTAISIFYYNLQRFITPENKNTLPSRIRSIGQVLLIIWFPFLSNWPSAISFYMLCNAVFTVIQTNIMMHPKFMTYIDPKMMLYQFLLRSVEYDKAQSDALIKAISSSEETHDERGIKEDVLVKQMKDSLSALNEMDVKETKEKEEQILY